MTPLAHGTGAAGVPSLAPHRLLPTALAGGLLAALAAVAVGFALLAGRAAGLAGAAAAYRSFLASGGWLSLPLAGAAAGCLAAWRGARERRLRVRAIVAATALAALAVAARPTVPEDRAEVIPTTRAARVRVLRRWAYRSPRAVARILPLADVTDPVVREAAVQALGANVIVTDVEHPVATRPSRLGGDPLRARLRARLEAALGDSAEAVRVQAARALWQSPVAFGDHPAAADTLAAALARPDRERLAWIALAAARRRPDPRLAAAARGVAARTHDRALAAAARRVATAP